MNETRITDYALNELQGKVREAFEFDLAADQHLQNELDASSRVADGLAQIMSEPGEGLEPMARERLLRAIAENQQALRQRQKMVRFAVPVSLAAAASIAVLLLVVGGKTTQETAVAAAGVPGSEKSSSGKTAAFVVDSQLVVANGLSESFAAQISSKGQVFVFQGDQSHSTDYSPQTASQVGHRRDFNLAGTRTVQMRESASMGETIASQDTFEIRVRPLLWESPETLGLGAGHRDGRTELWAP